MSVRSGHVGNLSFYEKLFILTNNLRQVNSNIERCECSVSFASRCIFKYFKALANRKEMKTIINNVSACIHVYIFVVGY